jgi:quinolinate synthase
MATALAYEQFDGVPDEDCDARIRAAKAKLGKRLVILGHHYQRDEVYRHADFTGDSLKLSRLAASSDADYIVFCGVHFMAEVADILSRPEQISILPDLSAGCSMADMANYAAVERAWKELGALFDPDTRVTPVTYINSSAELKAGWCAPRRTPRVCWSGRINSARRCCSFPTSTSGAIPPIAWAWRWKKWWNGTSPSRAAV